MQNLRDGVPFAIDAQGRFQDVANVPRGLECACFCADCKGPVVAKKGEINIHHFAHHDLHDCRDALEASIFGMLMELAKDPTLRLRVPSIGNRCELVPYPDRVFTEEQSEAFFRAQWVIDAQKLELSGARFGPADLASSTSEQADISLPQLDIHIASHRKSQKDVQQATHKATSAVLLLDIRDYVRIWWSVCDERKDERVKAAATATAVMRLWLEKNEGGRTWLIHPEFEREKAKLNVWIKEKSSTAAEWRCCEYRSRRAMRPWLRRAQFKRCRLPIRQEDGFIVLLTRVGSRCTSLLNLGFGGILDHAATSLLDCRVIMYRLQ